MYAPKISYAPQASPRVLPRFSSFSPSPGPWWSGPPNAWCLQPPEEYNRMLVPSDQRKVTSEVLRAGAMVKTQHILINLYQSLIPIPKYSRCRRWPGRQGFVASVTCVVCVETAVWNGISNLQQLGTGAQAFALRHPQFSNKCRRFFFGGVEMHES